MRKRELEIVGNARRQALQDGLSESDVHRAAHAALENHRKGKAGATTRPFLAQAIADERTTDRAASQRRAELARLDAELHATAAEIAKVRAENVRLRKLHGLPVVIHAKRGGCGCGVCVG